MASFFSFSRIVLPISVEEVWIVFLFFLESHMRLFSLNLIQNRVCYSHILTLFPEAQRCILVIITEFLLLLQFFRHRPGHTWHIHSNKAFKMLRPDVHGNALTIIACLYNSIQGQNDKLQPGTALIRLIKRTTQLQLTKQRVHLQYLFMQASVRSPWIPQCQPPSCSICVV